MTPDQLKSLLENSSMTPDQKSAFVGDYINTMDFDSFTPEIGDELFAMQDSFTSAPTSGFDVKGLLGDKTTLGNISGLAGTLMQAAALPSMLENAKLQNKSLKFNLNTAKQEQARRNKNISGFNNHPTSAFM